MTMLAAEELKDIIHKRIESLRPKLLDLSRRNPLISIKLNSRSNSHVRVIDRLPDILFFNLTNGERMKFIPLPSLDEEPVDERSDVFKRAFAEARRTDPDYLTKVEKLDKDADDYSDIIRKAERSLKDKLRVVLGFSSRPMKQDVNLNQHARNHGISPAYDLPEAGKSPEDVQHTDATIQMLLLPEDLERKLSALNSKCNTWLQETGLNVLHGAFGFLEWSEKGSAETSFAPLILLQVKIVKQKTSDGPEFWGSGLGEEPETNAVLSEKLKQEFDIELPAFISGSIEEYLAEIAKLSPKSVTWRVRRQVAFGVFPSARMAMFHDLNTAATNFADNDIIRPLLGGNGAAVASPFADEYMVDTPEIEKAVPYIVMDADASQFSTLVDIANGKNLAVEGPPGSGKSQTIVNTIASALAAGKKILFVAEKTAALEVVRARLDVIGLGEFLLPLQAQHSTRESVIQSLRDRLEMDAGKPVVGLDNKISSFKEVRAQLADYISVITTPFEESGFTVHDILGNSVATAERLSLLPKSLQLAVFPSKTPLTKAAIEDAKTRACRLEQAASEIAGAKPHWKGTGATHLTPFDLEGIIEAAKNLAARIEELQLRLSHGRDFGLAECENPTAVDQVIQMFQDAERLADPRLLELVPKFADVGSYKLLTEFIEDCDAFQLCASAILPKLSAVPTEETLEALAEIESLCRKHAIEQLHADELTLSISKKREAIAMANRLHAQMEPFALLFPGSDQWRFSDIGLLRSIIIETERECLHARRPDLALDPNALGLIRNLNSQGRKLLEERNALVELFALHIAPEVDECVNWLTTFKSAGTFAFLSAAYRRAKASYIGLSRGKWSRAAAIQNLAWLVDWKTRERNFRLNPQATVLYDVQFRGLDTDFDLMEGVVAFYEAVREKFPRLEQSGAREFLLHSPVEVLLEVPELEPYPEAFTLKALKEGIAPLEAEALSREANYKCLHGHIKLFSLGERPSTAQISEFSVLLKDYLSRKRDLDNRSELSNMLGELYAGAGTPTNRLKPIATICEAVLAGPDPEMLAAAVGAGRAAHGIRCAQQLRAAINVVYHLEREFLNKTKLSDASGMISGTHSARVSALRAAAADPEGLLAHSAFAAAKTECHDHLHGLIDQIEDAIGGYAGLADILEALAFRSLARNVYGRHGGALARFNGGRLNDLRAQLARLDKEIILATRKDLRAKISAKAQPPRGIGTGRKSTWTDYALIANEVEKKRKHISVRELALRAGNALLELKPCLMMSPLAVAQYLPKQSIKFDLCIIDEASQMPPEEAIGALARSKQAMIVGDTNQLPPSNFFRKLIDSDGDGEVDEDENVLSESILELANATFRPARRLRWHYRSKHSGLIKFSNRLVYNDDLVVFPSPSEGMKGMGVDFRAILGLYKAGINPMEAQEIVRAAIEFMISEPDRSLGIVTLNQKQRDLIFEEMEIALNSNPGAMRYVDHWLTHNDGLEEFFIKNLENVQGDERDVIFIGTVYGPEEPGGRVMQRFGPINGVAGKRRLNVLFTRAKQQIVTFSSMNASDITAEPTGNEGAYMLKRWLEYCATGILESGDPTGKEPDSDFELFVMKQIRAMGCIPIPQVGVKGYSIDIGVKHPQWAHGFVLGVECDGATFHSSRSARDRDRLRQEVLEALGWRFHRIWSTDWFANPAKQAEILRGVIEGRLVELRERESEFSRLSPAMPQAEPNAEISTSPQIKEVVSPETPVARAKPAGVSIGDTVRVRYLTHDKNVVQFTISSERSDPDNGIIHFQKPIAEALLGAEEGDEVEILVGTYVRRALLEKILTVHAPTQAEQKRLTTR